MTQENWRTGDRWSGFSQSSLTAKSHGMLVHRDYGAHFFRWSAARRLITDQTTVLDVGCGKDMPLAKVLMGAYAQPKSYTGIDLNKIAEPARAKWLTLHDQTSALEIDLPGTFDVVICFEVIEHMGKEDGERLIRRLVDWRGDRGTLLMSTPVFHAHKAADHIYEWSREEIMAAVNGAGASISGCFGTFARIPALRAVLTPEERSVFNRLAAYYDYNALSLIFAPLHPEVSSNNIWVVGPADLRARDDEESGATSPVA